MFTNKFLLPVVAMASLIVPALSLPTGQIQQQQGNHRLATRSIHLKIMPLGASATFGIGSSTGNGYREDLRELLEATSEPGSSSGSKDDDKDATAYEVEYVGSLQSGTMQDKHNEGWRGLVIDEIREKASESLPVYEPDLVLVLAGTNDCNKNLDIGGVHDRMADLLDAVYDSSPQAAVVLATLQPSGKQSVHDRTNKANSQIRDLVEEHQARGRPVVIADMRRGEDPVRKSDLADNLHPNDEGYAKMAKIWDAAIREADEKGFLKGARN